VSSLTDNFYKANLSRGIAGTLAASVDISDLLVAGDQTQAAANAASLQAIIAAMVADGNYRPITIKRAGSYYFNQVKLYDNIHFDIGVNVSIVKPDNYQPSMFINEGALNGTPTANKNIKITGRGTIDGNVANQSGQTQAIAGAITANTFLYGIQGEIAMINVDGLEVSVRNPKNCRGFFVQFQGSNGHFHDMRPDTTTDFIHINGPTNHVVINDCKGFSSADFIGLNAWDWHRNGPTTGTINDITVKDCEYNGSNGTGAYAHTGMFVKFLSGTRTTGAGANGLAAIQNVRIDGFKCDPTIGTAVANSPTFGMIGDWDQAQGSEYSGVGLVENVTIKSGQCTVPSYLGPFFLLAKTASPSDADGQCSVNVRRFTVESVFVDCSKGQQNSYNPIGFMMKYNTCTLNDVVFRDMDWTPAPLNSDQGFITLANKTLIDSFEVDGLTINENTGATAATAVVLVDRYDGVNPCIVDDFTCDRIKTSAGYLLRGAWLKVNAGINNFRSRGNHINGAGNSSVYGSGIYVNTSVAFIKRGVISEAVFNGVLIGVNIDSVSATGVNMHYENCNLINMSHPVFVNGAFNARVTYRGGNIDTSTNLVNSQGTLTVSYDGTTSSGTGAAALTRSAGTVRVLKADQIAFAAAAPMNPANNDVVLFSATPPASPNATTGTGAGTYIYSGSGSNWIKQN